jgi:predicted O-methyltransferase YrrM
MSSKLAPWEKLLPNQSFNSDQYKGTVPIEQALYERILSTSGLLAPDVNFQVERSDLFTIEEMASNAVALGFLTWILRLIDARRVLEIGSFVGVSAMHFAKSMPADGHVVTIEKFDHFAAIARRNFAVNGFTDRIELVEGDAHNILPTLKDRGPFDLAFIDGNKERYADYFRLIEPMMTAKGVIVIDDAFFHGDVLNNSTQTEKGRGVRAVLEIAARMEGWNRILLPLSNGMMLMHRHIMRI